MAHHAKEAALQAMTMPGSPTKPIIGPIVGLMRRFDLPVPGLSGIVIGSLAWMASKVAAPRKGGTLAP